MGPVVLWSGPVGSSLGCVWSVFGCTYSREVPSRPLWAPLTETRSLPLFSQTHSIPLVVRQKPRSFVPVNYAPSNTRHPNTPPLPQKRLWQARAGGRGREGKKYAPLFFLFESRWQPPGCRACGGQWVVVLCAGVGCPIGTQSV